MGEAGLSFLGLGVQPPTPSWGNLIGAANNFSFLKDYPWFWVAPAVVLVGTVVSFNLVGDSLRDVFDPHRRA
jgi:peptide/nickel transport system permease protein